jgi:hypothetical protein
MEENEHGKSHSYRTYRRLQPRGKGTYRHPFFIGTLFQPELSAYANVAHPLIMAFLQAIAEVSPRNAQVRFMEE